MPDVARVVTVRELGSDFPQVGVANRLTAERTEALQSRCPPVDQNEFRGAILHVRYPLHCVAMRSLSASISESSRSRTLCRSIAPPQKDASCRVITASKKFEP
jgi:hypothetical protein